MGKGLNDPGETLMISRCAMGHFLEISEGSFSSIGMARFEGDLSLDADRESGEVVVAGIS